MTSRLLPVVAALTALACASSGAGGGGGPSRPVGVAPVPEAPDAPPAGRSVLFSTAPPARYTVMSTDTVTTELPDGALQVQQLYRGAEVTIAVFPEASGGYRIDIGLDTLWVDSMGAVTRALADSARGTRWTGHLAPSGHLSEFEPDRSSAYGERLRTVFARLFPVLPGGGVRSGEAWTDSTSRPWQLIPAVQATEDRNASYAAGGWQMERGEQVLPLTSLASYTVQGSGEQFGQAMDIGGGGLARGTHEITVDGRLLTASVSDSVRLVITLPEVGQTVPMTVKGHYTLQRLP